VDAIDHFDRQYGRKLTIDLPDNGGRTTAAFYFVNGRIVSLQRPFCRLMAITIRRRWGGSSTPSRSSRNTRGRCNRTAGIPK